MKIAKIFLSVLILFTLSQATAWAADGNCHTLEVPLGTFTQACGPAEYLTKIYTISVGLAVVLAVVMIVYAGIIYATSGDNASKQKEARSQITQAILGLAILLASYLILRTVNPDLTNLGKWENLPVQQVPPAAGIASNSEECQAKRSASASCVAKNCNKLGTSTAENCNCLVNCCNQAGISPNCGNCRAPGCF